MHVIRGRVRDERLALDDAPALTVHAHSPPLTRMGAYMVEPSGKLTRHSASCKQELRPLAV